MPLMAIPLAYWAVGGLIVATGATIAWQQSGGPEATAEALNNLAQSMQGANQQAQTQAPAISTTCTGNCTPPPNCNDRNNKIKERVDELRQRFQDMVQDANNLYYHHYFTSQAHPQLGSYQGHQQQYDMKQKNLRRQMKEAEDAGCTVDVDEAEDWATNSHPQSPTFRYPTPPPP